MIDNDDFKDLRKREKGYKALGYEVTFRQSAYLSKSVVDVLNGRKIKELKPYSPYFKGECVQDENNNKRWISRGIYTKQGPTSIRITELPMSITYEKYEIILI